MRHFCAINKVLVAFVGLTRPIGRILTDRSRIPLTMTEQLYVNSEWLHLIKFLQFNERLVICSIIIVSVVKWQVMFLIT